MFWLIAIPALVVIYACFRVIMSPNLRYHTLAYKIKAAIIFKAGGIRRLPSAPWITWDGKFERKVDFSEVREAQRFCKPGYVGLHKDEGFGCNLAIPGAFKHAWIFVEDSDIVEATEDGVLKRDNMFPLASDFAVILRPIGVTDEEAEEAVKRANAIVGCEYDANFNFNLDETEEIFSQNLRCDKFHAAFSCTETVGFSWLKCRDKLGIFRTKQAGREAIIADDFMRMRFEIVWASQSTTVEWAEDEGLHEEGRHKLQEYWASHARKKLPPLKGKKP
jgi:hypothetical protein